MEDKYTTLWQIILAELETEISRANYLTLFKNTTLLSVENNVATIAAPSAMTIDLIQRRFYEVVKKICQKHLGSAVVITFVPKVVVTETTKEKETPLFSKTVSTPTGSSIGHLARVRPEFTFQNMAVSGSNQLAFISAQTVANNIGGSYNPLFIYGPVGVGKTHLMQAVANEVYRRDPSAKILYVTSEEFTNEVVEAIRGNQTQAMKKKFRNATLLLIDDVQFIAGKDKVQEELFHTFNILIDKGAQVVLSSDRPPHEIKKLESRLSSRFAGGLTVDIEPPDFELKTAILLIKAGKFGADLSIEVAKVIADRVEDTRSLEGALLRILTLAKTKNVPITEDLAIRTLGGTLEEKNHSFYHPDDVIRGICTFYNIKPTQLKGPKRDASLVKARQITMYLLKKELNLTFAEIGNLLGGRDHTTVMHGVEKVETLVDKKAAFHEEIVGITKTLRGQLS